MGILEVRYASPSICREVDRDWPIGRDPDEESLYWSWEAMLRDSEGFALVEDATRRTVGLWRAPTRRLISLPGGQFYRLDNIEVAPDCRDAGNGYLLVALASYRALELEADGMVGGAVPDSVPFFEAMGAVLGPGDVPFDVDLRVVEAAASRVDGSYAAFC